MISDYYLLSIDFLFLALFIVRDKDEQRLCKSCLIKIISLNVSRKKLKANVRSWQFYRMTDYNKAAFFLQIQLIIHCCSAAIDEGFSGKGIKIVSIDDAEKTQYDERGLDQGTYNYGAEIDKNLQFNHQTRASDGITYGCFGYLDDVGNLQSKHYIADARGFRLLTSLDVVEVFPIATKSK
jgi:hypothetical protein